MYCLLHDPDRAEERRAMLSEHGRAGQAKRTKRTAAIRAKLAAAVALDTSAAIRAALEHSLAEVQASDAGAIEKANATARLCTVALSVLRNVDLENEVAELRRLVEERLGVKGNVH